MNFKKIFLSVNLALFAFTCAQIFTQDVVIENTEQQKVDNKVMIKTIFTKLSEKKELSKEEKEIFELYRNCIVGSVVGLFGYYIIPPVGFGTLLYMLVKTSVGVASAIGAVEFMKNYTWDDVKHKFNECFA